MSEMSLSDVLPGGSAPDPSRAGRRGADRARRRRNRQRRRRTWLAVLIAVLVVVVAAAGSWYALAPTIRKVTEPRDYPGPGTGTVRVQIPAGASGSAIAGVLAKAGVVKTEVAFVEAAKRDERSSAIQSGTYELRSRMSAAGALKILVEPTNRLVSSVTIPEGTRAKQVLDLLAKNLQLDAAALKKASTSGDIGLPAAAKGKPEGYLFPATYEFGPDATPVEVLSAMVERGRQAHQDLGIPASKLRSIVIKASIVQAEAGNTSSMGKVARVLENRLKDGERLQLDSTVSYAVNRFGVTTTAAERAVDSRYNTYKYAGLPAGPISNPGEDALRAALRPTAGDWMFFVTTNPDTGETKFAVDEAGHAKYVKEFQAWLAAKG
jgi:UPF0755 protein